MKLCDRYQALKPIGQGGFGRTFLAVDLSQSMKPRCVIKQLYPQQQGVQAKASELFRQEAQQLMTAGQYPSIPRFLDYFEQEGFQYLVQEYIEGQNLAEILKTGQVFKESEVKALLETMLETVDFLHHHKIIHRDIKPANIIRSPNGQFILVDLGAAKLATGTALGQTGTVIGSAEYVAPEQLRGKAIFASDLYSLGATCVTLLTGISPFSLFDTSTGAWAWRNYLVENPVSESFGKILDRLLIGPTKLRYGSADQVLEDLVEKLEPVKGDAIDRLHLPETLVVTEEKADGLGIEMTQPGEVVGQEDDRLRKRLDLTISLFSIGVFVMLPIGALVIANLNSQTPAPEAPTPKPPLEQVKQLEPATPRSYNPNPDEILISKYIKPTYSKSVKPSKIFRNIPSFKVFGLRSDNKTLVTGMPLDLIDSNGGNKFSINQLNMETGVSQEFTILSPGTNSGFSQAPGSSNSDQYESFLRNDNLIYQPFTKEHKLGLMKIFNLQSNSFIPLPLELTTKQDTMTLPIRGGRGAVVVNGNSYAIWGILPYGTLTKLTKPSVEDLDTPNIVSNDLQKAIVYEEKNKSPRLVDLSPESKSIDIALKVPALFRNDYYNVSSEFFQNKDRKLLISSKSESQLNDVLKIREFLPMIYQQKISTIQNKAIKFQYKNSIIYGFDSDLNKFRYLIPRSGSVSSPTISPDGKTMFFIEQNSSAKLTVWDTLTGKLLREVDLIAMSSDPSAKSSERLELTPDGKNLVIAESKGILDNRGVEPYVSIWNVEELRNP